MYFNSGLGGLSFKQVNFVMKSVENSIKYSYKYRIDTLTLK